ncbi:MAG TPA: YihY/virulence factor BrkB family protein [Solirubrobacteraceae bacterium]|jgi:YihY family inner membrane protein
MSILERRQALDRLQQSRTGPAFIAAVIKKFGDDRAGNLAALIAYYAFVSLFPLLLVFVTILGYTLDGDPRLKQEILEGTLGKFPLLSDQLKLHSLSGNGLALAFGIVLTLLAGLGVTGASQTAFNRIWAVPFSKQPNFLTSRLRGIALLLTLGALTIVSTLAGGFVGASESGSAGAWALIAGVIVALIANFVLFASAFKLLTAIALSWRDVLPGAVLASALWTLLQYFGGLYVSHELKNNGPLYGSFAFVLGLLAWLYLGAQLTMLSAEVNAVLARKLWPRSLFAPGLLDADRRAMRAAVRAQNRNVGERIEVHFEEPKEEDVEDVEAP